MDPIRWQQIEDAFHQAAGHPAGPAREALVRTLCGHDEGLAHDVFALLDEDDRAASADRVEDPHIGLRLGAFEIDSLIARGGMAAVYRAHRADDQFQQQVAIKIMDLRLSDPVLVAQFRAERQILASLEHPSLTRLLDGGVTAIGEPYLVMEYVDGLPIDQYCDRERLDVAARLRLFGQVCEGVAFAHRSLVAHRDLKPSNILMTAEGQAKVVDFGTATLLHPDRQATTSRAPFTPAYASPEQLTSQAVGAASDQYSLALVLYELLTGARAFGERTSLIAAVERAMARTVPPSPRTVLTEAAAAARGASLARLSRQLSGDIATILTKALAPEPSARYASVTHFADDLKRWLEGAPILGRPPSVRYRATRFVQRHWVAVSVAGALAAGLVGATAVSIERAAHARRQEALARAESETARRLSLFMGSMLSSANPGWFNSNARAAGTITVREVLDGAAKVVGTELAGSPAVEAAMRRTLGETYVGLGAYDQGAPQLERALVLYRTLGDALGVAQTQAAMGTEQNRRARYKEAEGLLRQALAYVQSPGSQADPQFHITVRAELATVLGNQRPAHPEAVALLRENIELADRHRINTPALAIVFHNLGLQLLLAGKTDESELLLRESLRRLDALPLPPNERFMALRSLSELMRTRQNGAEAVRFATEAVEGLAKAFPPEHPYHLPARVTLGRALLAAERYADGRDVLIDAYDAYRKVRPPGHVEFLGPMVGLGAAYRLTGDLRASEAILREARAIILANPGVRNSMPGIAGELGLTLRAMGRTDEATTLLRDAHEHLQQIYGDDHPSTRRALDRLNGSNM